MGDENAKAASALPHRTKALVAEAKATAHQYNADAAKLIVRLAKEIEALPLMEQPAPAAVGESAEPVAEVDVPALLVSHENLRMAYNKAIADLCEVTLRFTEAAPPPSPDVAALQAQKARHDDQMRHELRKGAKRDEQIAALQAENERLTKERDEWRDAAFLSDNEAQSGQLEEMTAEVERLKAVISQLKQKDQP